MRTSAQPLTGAAGDYDALMDIIGDASYVLLGGASHGTHEFYRERAQITKRLIEEKSFTAVAVEGDWPSSYRVNRYVRGASKDGDASEALSGFLRFPAWMWRNTDVIDFIEWLRARNQRLDDDRSAVGFYGMDLYSLHVSIRAVIEYLDGIDPKAADRTRAQYICLNQFGIGPRGYGLLGPLERPCKDEALRGLVELQESPAVRQARRAGAAAEEDYFNALQNARVVKNAEAYYSSMYRTQVRAWNLRAQHLAASLENLLAHLKRQGGRAKIAVWAHNAHLGDARATEKGQEREVNIGQILREEHGRDAVLVGFTTHHGTVTAASDWEGPAEIKELRPALPDSYEGLFHDTELGSFLLISQNRDHAPEALREPRLERAIGVIYHSETPEIERASHYFNSRMIRQFDAIIHFDESRAVEALERRGVDPGEVPCTYPFEV